MSAGSRIPRAAALRATGIAAGWGPRTLLGGLELALRPGDRLAVLGPNGAGKTTLFDVLSGRLRPRSGRVLLGGEDVTAWPVERRARAGLGYVPQESTVFPRLSVRANLQAALRAPARRGPVADLEDELVLWGLSGQAEQTAGTLSGGERRRLEVARALLLGPDVLLLDEPFAGLDPGGRAQLAEGLRQIPAHVAVALTDHAAADLLALATRLLVLVDGSAAFEGPPAAFDAGHAAWSRYFGGPGTPG